VIVPKYKSLEEVQHDLQTGKINCVKLVEYYLENIQSNIELNVFLEVFEAEALQQATELDERMTKGEKVGQLAGMIIGLKDVICYKDHPISAGSKMLENFRSLFSATAVERLLNEDAIIIGRINCDEFAMGSTNEFSAFGPTLNAYDKTKVPGGSSGGSAVAVQADMCLAALGSDTGGSVRQPASFCNVIGFKPSYGRISRHGLIAYASSFDQIGVLAHSLEDTTKLFDIMAGPDEFDSTASQQPTPQTHKALKHPTYSHRFTYFKEVLENDGLDIEVKKAFEKFVEQLKEQGHIVEAIEFPLLEYMVPAYYVMTCAEASSNLSRYDGIHFGHRSAEAKDLFSTYTKSRTEAFGKEVKRRIILGTYVLSSGYYDAYYTKAQKIRRLISEATQVVLEEYDVILSPTATGTAFGLGELIDQDPTAMYLSDIYTVQANLTGIPAISLPLFTHSNGLPFGLQMMAGRFEETKLFSIAQTLMKNQKI